MSRREQGSAASICLRGRTTRTCAPGASISSPEPALSPQDEGKHSASGRNRVERSKRSILFGALVPVLFALFGLALAGNADAAAQRNFKEEFGPAEKVNFEGGLVGGIVIDQTSGDVLIPSFASSSGPAAIRRFHADGTPAPFEALGTNVIDGAEDNGKPCPEEPASCDRTQEEKIEITDGETPTFQIAIDESGGIADGDIYLSQAKSRVVDVFSAEGRYLGQLTGYGSAEFRKNPPEGVAVDEEGTVYVADDATQINVFVPTQNPVSNADLVSNIAYPTDIPDGYQEGGIGYGLAVGTGPTAGSLFVASYRVACVLSPQGECSGRDPVDRIFQFDKDTGRVLSEFAVGEFGRRFQGTNARVTVNPTNGNVVDGTGREFEVRSGSAAVQVSHLDPEIFNHQGGLPGLGSGVAVNSSNEVVLADARGPGSGIEVYGVPETVPTVAAEPATEIAGTRAVLAGTVDPAGLPLAGEKCYFEYGLAEEGDGRISGFKPEGKASCEGSVPTNSKPNPVKGTATGLESGGSTYGFRLVAVNQNGQEQTSPPLYFKTEGTVVTEPATDVGLNSATLNGSVRSEGEPLTECFFEYGLSSAADFEKTVPCDPGAAAIGADYRAHKVEAAIGGLQSDASYRYRLVATSADASIGTQAGEEESFDTFGLPRVVEAVASDADQGSFTLEARINPSGFGTRYRFEWGPTAAYGNVAPLEFEPFVGSGTEPILVKARISGLAPGTAYHYRVVAESNRGSDQSDDQIAETLNSCGLPEGRCFEEVSRHEAGPVAVPGESNAHIELHFQAATAPGGFAFPIESGYPEATKGAEVLYRGLRTPGGWESNQLSAPLNAPNESPGSASQGAFVQWLSDDLACGFIESTSPLTADPSMNYIRERGGSNLYRIDPDGSYTAVTTLPPQGLRFDLDGLGLYSVAWGSQDCGVTLFSSLLAYPGVPAVKGENRYLYEWRDGTLRNAGLVPGPNGAEIAVEAAAGAGNGGAGSDTTGYGDTQNAVSSDGSRVFFTALRQTSPNPEEISTPSEKKAAVFVREDGRVSRDVSLSQTAVPDKGAIYQWATADGSKVFFTANEGLAAGTAAGSAECDPTTGEGCDLYEYDLTTGKLTDRTATPTEGGAQVRGFLGASADGSRVYFASANRLDPGKGNSLERNRKVGSYSIYSEAGGLISFAGTLASEDVNLALIENQALRVSQVTRDGRYLLFESRARVTGYANGDVKEAYLYDADADEITCVSCRQDGKPSEANRYGSPSYGLLRRGDILNNILRSPLFLAERDGEAKVFFNSPDPLAPGAVPGQNNVYEWAHDQVFRLASAPAGSQVRPEAGRNAVFGGASEDATDIYLITPETLTWEDGDERQSAYDARLGGGFPEPAAPAAPCRAAAEASCAAPPAAAAAPQDPATTGDLGSQNVESKKKKHYKKKHHKKKHHGKNRKGKHHRQAKGKKNQTKKLRRAGGDRRNGK